MTTVRAASLLETASPGATTTAVFRLAGTEARRILLHPAALVVALVFLALLGFDRRPLESLRNPSMVKEGLEYFFLLYYGLLMFFAVNLVASSARRSGAEGQLAAAPLSGQQRTLATCLAVLAPVAVASLAAAGIYALSHGGAVTLAKALTPAELMVIPLCALGSGLLAVAVARWLPWPATSLGVAVALVFWVAFVQEKAGWAWSAPWTASHTWVEHPTLLGGSQGWHAVYLLGSAILAGLAALLRHNDNRRRLLLAAGLVVIGTVVAGTLQLP